MNYTVSELAENDIENILTYTIENWGINQATKYQLSIDNAIDIISENPLITTSKTFGNSKKQVSYLRVERHNIYYKIEVDIIITLRVLHQQMHPNLHL